MNTVYINNVEIFSPGFNLDHTTLYKWTKYNTRLWWLVLELVNNFLEFIICQCPWVFFVDSCKNKISIKITLL